MRKKDEVSSGSIIDSYQDDLNSTRTTPFFSWKYLLETY